MVMQQVLFIRTVIIALNVIIRFAVLAYVDTTFSDTSTLNMCQSLTVITLYPFFSWLTV